MKQVIIWVILGIGLFLGFWIITFGLVSVTASAKSPTEVSRIVEKGLPVGTPYLQNKNCPHKDLLTEFKNELSKDYGRHYAQWQGYPAGLAIIIVGQKLLDCK